MEESVSITVGLPTMQERITEAAQKSDVEALYELIRENADILKEIDQREFVDTPLHIAAAAGRTEFAMEVMDLKPSFATKLNQDGLSPIHLALYNGNSETALSLLTLDKNLVRIKGKNGYTPLHYAVIKGDLVVLTKFLEDCPESILDVTNQNETCLHIAAKKNNLKALHILLPTLLWSSCSRFEINNLLNFKDRDGNTVLHIAANNNQPKIVRLLTTYGSLDLKATNSNNLTALGILRSRDQEENQECVNIVCRAQALNAFRSFPWYLIQMISQLTYEIRTMSGDRTNALLVVTVLILTATYQAALSPPGGVFQANALSKDNTTNSTSSLQIHSGLFNTSTHHHWTEQLKRIPSAPGSSVLQTSPFLWFFIPNIAAFCISFLVTCFVLICSLTWFFSSALVISLSLLLFCLLVSAVLIISPNSKCLDTMLHYVYILAYILVTLMYLIIIIVLVGKLLRRIFRYRIKKSNET